MDYYKVLNIEPNANVDDICNSFRKLAIQHHPMRNPDKISVAQAEFSKVCEAYDVLSNPELKDRFDKHGAVGLKNGVTCDTAGKTIGGYAYQGNSIDIFEAFFGSKNPYTDNFDRPAPAKIEEAKEEDDGKPTKDIVVVLECSIYEFYNGSLKTFEYER